MSENPLLIISLMAEVELLREALMVVLRVREDEVQDWARRLIEADARATTPWLDRHASPDRAAQP